MRTLLKSTKSVGVDVLPSSHPLRQGVELFGTCRMPSLRNIAGSRAGTQIALYFGHMLTACLVLSASWWAFQIGCLLRGWKLILQIPALPPGALPHWPKVSVVIPARNESDYLAAALNAKLNDGYPNLELIVVDDRSTDGTGFVAQALARADSRIRVVRIDELPPDWLGKVHALQRGLESAWGEWVLFSDADVHLSPGVLSRLISYAETKGVDHLTAIPQVTAAGPLIAPALAFFFRFVTSTGRPWAAQDASSKAFFGIGAFNLFRRSALEQTPGLAWLKMEIGDDAALGLMLKRWGARQRVVVAKTTVSLAFYPSCQAMVRALEKNGASAPFPILLSTLLTLLVLESAATIPLLFGDLRLQVLAALLWACASLCQYAWSRWLELPRWPALVPFLGVFPLTYALVRSAVLAVWRGGVMWRGTFYPTRILRAGMRLGLGGDSAKDRQSVG